MKRYLEWLALASLVFLTSGCGLLGGKPQWPASVVSITGMTDTQKASVVSALNQMNTESNVQLLTDEAANGTNTASTQNAYPISITIAPVSASAPDRAGYAQVGSNACDITLSIELFDDAHQQYITPVVWHEIGHCTGLVHVYTQGEIMYPTCEALDQYASSALQRFFQNAANSAGL